ncbi:MAG: ABC transporter ATP-binding protein, partial [Clostridia bacterium]|nr:ABC transporter ATP-binding protein [Clostridia bacterium]
MLSLREIVKTYITGDTAVHALGGVSIDFRESEFVSILGPSGCGKTTLLNVIGGLDRYDGGDLVINGRSTKEYRDADWDTYRNHSIGFVFQSYNLITHQTVLSNVELALTLSGVSREERRARAIEALEKVGLGDQIHKKPNQMSGGQMQRVAIARALVNDPDILLADEPTGALDTATSVQVMDILREVAKEKLVIMVTHNPELAAEYSTRIIRLKDGLITDDSNPFVTPVEQQETETIAESADAAPTAPEKKRSKKAKKNADGKGKKSMSFLTALSLSLNNLMTKKTRTLLVSVAGSIGIIGIALILALSNGVNLFIANIQEETLTSYPISITAETSDYAAMLSAMVGTSGEDKADRDPNKIYVDDSISNMVSAMTTMDKNNLAKFNEYLKSRYDEIKGDLTAIQYSYNMDLQIYNASTQYGENGVLQVSPSGILSDFGNEYGGLSMITDSISIFSEIMPGRDGELINQTVYEQYNLVDGRWPENQNELVLVVDRNNTVANITLYMLGMLNPDEMTAMMAAMMLGEKYDAKTEGMSFGYQDFYDLDLNLGYNSDFFAKSDATYEANGKNLPLWKDLRDEDGFLPETVYDKGLQLKIVGVIAPNPDASSTSISGAIGYTSALTNAVLAKVGDSELVKQQLENPTHDVFTGLPFQIDDVDTLTDAQKKEKLSKYFSTLTNSEKAALFLEIRSAISDAKMAEYLTEVKKTIDTAEKQREFLINLYAFNSKNGSLAVGTFANEAVATILHAIDPTYTIEQYQQMVATQYAAAFQLDGKEVKKDGEGADAYDKYAGLIDALYSTPEKLAQAFDNMTAMTIRSVYPMIEGINIQKELMQPTAPHFAAFLAQMNTKYPDLAAKRYYLYEVLCATNGIKPEDKDNMMVGGAFNPNYSLANSLYTYISTLQELEIEPRFTGELYKAYGNSLLDEATRNEATAALFQQYLDGLTEAEYAALYADYMEKSDSTYDENLILMGANVDDAALSAINIYPVDFEAKERLSQIITDYNNQEGLAEEDQISYTDMIAIMMSSVTIIIDAITYVLIAFVSISLV